MKLAIVLAIIMMLFVVSIMHAEAIDPTILGGPVHLAPFYPPFPSITSHPQLIGCTEKPVASQIIPHTAFYSIDLKPFSQFDGIPGLKEKSCTPASAASIMDYLNRTRFPGLTNGYTDASLIANLSVYMNTTINGTLNDQALFGVMRFLQSHNIMEKFTFKFYYKDYFTYSGGKSFPPGPHNITKKIQPQSPGDFIWVNELPNYQNVFNEFVNDHELIIIGYTLFYPDLNENFEHSMALDNIDKEKNVNGNYNVSFMDPFTAQIIYGEMSQNGTVYFPSKNSIGAPKDMEVISQK